MSSPVAAAGDTPQTPPAMPNLRSSSSTPSSVSGITRSREQFDADSGDDTTAESPHPKLARTVVSVVDSERASGPPASGSESESDDPTAVALLEELECGMCAGVFIDPVALNGCGHVYCGSCVQQWINSIHYPLSLLPGDPVPEPIACPHCRHTPIQTATPSRLAKTMVTFLLTRMPSAARPANEVRQANDLYRPPGHILKFPTPPPAPRQPCKNEFWRPCKYCYPAEEGAWKCPQPVARFDVPEERERCMRADGIPPDGHRLCAGCDQLSPNASPKSANCGICGEGFCGDTIMGCECVAVSQSKPSSQFNHLAHVLQDGPMDLLALAFKDNWQEMSFLGDFLADDESRTAATIYHSILEWLRTAEGMDSGGMVAMMNRADISLRIRTGMANELQQAIMPVEEGAKEALICGGCADEILCAGFVEWWMRELQKPEVLVRLPATFKDRPNCKHGRKCTRQENERHGKKFNHICEPLPADEAAKLHQDDSAPAKTTAPPPGADSSLSSESPQESDSDSDDDGPSYVDAETQYEANPHGTVISVSAQHPMLPKWLPDSQGIAPLSIANILNLDAPIRGSSSSSSPIHRPLSPHPALRVSGSASTPLAGSFSWPSIYRRAETPPLGMSTASNIGSADSELAVTTASKLSIPLSPTPVKGQSRDHSTAIDVDM